MTAATATGQPITSATALGAELKLCILQRERRIEKRITKALLARRIAVSPSSLYSYLKGTTLPPGDVLDHLLSELEVPAVVRRRLTTARDELESGVSTPTLPRPALPPDVPWFLGRTAQLGALSLLSQAGTAGVCALTGTAGVGKTALAVHWAHRARDRFRDGCLYLDLRGYCAEQPLPAGEALGAVLCDLGMPGCDIPQDLDERTARLRALLATRRMLIVLDNARDAEQVRPLLPAASPSFVLVTSRDSLAGMVARDGAGRVELALLPDDDAVALLRTLIGARADDEPDAVAELSQHCARLPLALRIAAELAHTRHPTSLADLAGELADQQCLLDRLGAGGDPHTAIRAVFSWSYRHLPDDTARVFRLLGRHPGLAVPAVARMAGTTVAQARGLLDQLVRAHLAQEAGFGRFRMHHLLRCYAAELAARDEHRPNGHGGVHHHPAG